MATYDLSKIITPSGDTLNIKDQTARDMATGGTRFIGKLYVSGTSYTHLTDGDTRTSVEIIDTTSTGHHSVTAAAGDIVLDDGNEFIFDGSAWELMGHDNLGNLAFADTASGTVTTTTYGDPTPNQTSTAGTVNITQNNSGNLAITGTFTQPTISGTATVTGTASISTTTDDYQVLSSTSVPSGKNKSYTPAGSVSAPTISLAANGAGSTTTIKNPTSKTVVTSVGTSAASSTPASGALSWASYDSTTETLTLNQITASTGASISTSNVTVKTGDGTYEASQPTFTGTDIYLWADDVQKISSTSASVTASGDISATATGGAYTPKKYQIGVNYDKTTSISQGTPSTTSQTVTVYPDNT